jgi:hypothetical protein
MKSAWLYRSASILFLLFAAGHTWGFLQLRPPNPEGEAVRQAMNNVHFQMGGNSFSYGEFYIGFGLYVTLYLLFSAFLAWHLSRLASVAPRTIGALGWVFFAVQIGSLILCWRYFSVKPALLSALVAICLGWAMLLPGQSAGQATSGRPISQ